MPAPLPPPPSFHPTSPFTLSPLTPTPPPTWQLLDCERCEFLLVGAADDLHAELGEGAEAAVEGAPAPAGASCPDSDEECLLEAMKQEIGAEVRRGEVKRGRRVREEGGGSWGGAAASCKAELGRLIAQGGACITPGRLGNWGVGGRAAAACAARPHCGPVQPCMHIPLALTEELACAT